MPFFPNSQLYLERPQRAHLEKAGKLSSGDQSPSTKRLYFQQVTEKNIKTKTVNLSILNRQQN